MTEFPLAANGLPYRPCVGIVLINAAGLVWVGQRETQKYTGHSDKLWQLPQGGIDEGESPPEAAMRELWEEVGTRKAEIIHEAREWFTYDLPPDVLAQKKINQFGGQRQKYFAMRFLGEDSDIDLEVHHPEFDDWRWVELNEISELIVPFKRKVYEQVVAEFTPMIEKVRAGV